MKAIGKKSMSSLLKKISKKNRTREEDMGADGMVIKEVPVTDMVNARSAKEGVTVNVCVFSISDYHEVDWFVRTEQIEKHDITLRDTSLSRVTSLRALLSLYRFDYSRGTLSVFFHPRVRANNVIILFTCAMTGGRQVLNNGMKMLLLGGCHRPEASEQDHLGADLG